MNKSYNLISLHDKENFKPPQREATYVTRTEESEPLKHGENREKVQFSSHPADEIRTSQSLHFVKILHNLSLIVLAIYQDIVEFSKAID